MRRKSDLIVFLELEHALPGAKPLRSRRALRLAGTTIQWPGLRAYPDDYIFMVLKVIEYRSASTGGMLCSHSLRAAPRKR